MSQTRQHAGKSAWAVVAMLHLIALQALILIIALEVCGWFNVGQVVGFVAASVLLTFAIAQGLRRFLPIPAWQQAACALAVLLPLWQFPVMEQSHFFAEASRVRVGMTVTDAWTRLRPYAMARNNTMRSATFPDKEVAAVAKGIDPHFSGTR